MHLGFLLDLRNPPRWEQPWSHHYRQALERIEQLEAWGAGSVWLTEHHLFEDGYLPQPLTFAAAVAARTRRIRIGTGIVLAALRHPVHVAEEATVVDLLSEGRLELGIGAGYAPAEYQLFGADIAHRFTLTDTAVAEIRRLLDDGGVTPAPIQRPFPIWLGYQGPQGARRAGRLGVGLLSLDRALLDSYRQGLVDGGHSPDSARMGGLLELIVADDPESTRERLVPFYAHQVNTYRRARFEGTDRPVPSDLPDETVRSLIRTDAEGPGLAVVDVDGAVEAIRRRTADLPVEHVYLWGSVAGMPDDITERHLELTSTRVRAALE